MSEQSENDIVVDIDSPHTQADAAATDKAEASVSVENADTNASAKDQNDNDAAMDDVDTDDLLEEADAILSPSKVAAKRKTKTTRSRANGSQTRTRTRKAKATDDMDVDTADNSGSEAPKRKARRKAAPKKTKTTTAAAKPEKGKKVKKVVVSDMERAKKLAAEYPDTYWQFHADSGYNMIDTINENHPLEVVPCNISDQAAITSMTLSSDGTLLATFSNIGAVKIWDIEQDFKLVRKLRDVDETNIDEFYCGQFASEDQTLMVVGGKLKDRHRWSTEDEDNHIMPCPIKIFDIEEAKVIVKLEGHTEEILCIKALKFNGENYYISTSQDGFILKWRMDKDWTHLIEKTPMNDGQTCMAFTVSFMPNTGNKYFLAACDGHIRLFDFEESQLLQTFEDMYSSYCDCGKFITWLDESAQLPESTSAADEEKENMDVDRTEENLSKAPTDTSSREYTWFISRGAEMCDVDDGVSSIPNTCTLHKLIYPDKPGGLFELEQVKKFQHEDYHSNSWLVKITSNGRYILAPTIYGQIFVFNILTGQVTAILKEHEDIEVRDVIFHPYRPLIFSCGDDGCVKVYASKATEASVEQDLDVGMSN